MKKFLVGAAAAAMLLSGAGAALANGPSGSTEDSTNNVSCGGTRTPAGTAYAGANGAEICNDGAGAPIQGRIIVSVNGAGSYAAADGDANNNSNATGWSRLDSSGPHCGSGDATTKSGEHSCP
ncbi:MAG: hypothetical protein QOG03_1850 [Actinomycetota bacterium]|jgi:hypothetical protein|nr:hypothetical protein [Actinomycetota bacterium]